MANPTDKSAEIEEFLNHLIKQMGYGQTRRDAIMSNMCVTCGRPVPGFRDELSLKEYSISGMCQACQDGVFGSGSDANA